MRTRVKMLRVVSLVAAVVMSAGLVQAEEKAVAISRPPFGTHNRWPLYNFTQYLYIKKYDVHVLGTAGVSEWMMRESQNLVENLINALKNPADRKKFAGHRTFLVTDADPSIPGSRLGHRNTGGKGYSMFNEMLACATSIDTIRPQAKPVTRAWDTPVHEFAHAIEHTLGLEKRSDEVYKKHARKYNPDVAREYFTWSVQRWFDSTQGNRNRDNMPKWEYDYIATVFDAGNTWKPKCTRLGKVYELRKDDVKTTQADNRPDPVKIGYDEVKAMAGEYSQAEPQNDWHRGKITIEKRDGDGNPQTLKWTNKAGRSWLLHPDLKTAALNTGAGNPYHKKPNGKAFYIAFDNTMPGAPRVAGFWFEGALFIKAR